MKPNHPKLAPVPAVVACLVAFAMFAAACGSGDAISTTADPAVSAGEPGLLPDPGAETETRSAVESSDSSVPLTDDSSSPETPASSLSAGEDTPPLTASGADTSDGASGADTSGTDTSGMTLEPPESEPDASPGAETGTSDPAVVEADRDPAATPTTTTPEPTPEPELAVTTTAPPPPTTAPPPPTTAPPPTTTTTAPPPPTTTTAPPPPTTTVAPEPEPEPTTTTTTNPPTTTTTNPPATTTTNPPTTTTTNPPATTTTAPPATTTTVAPEPEPTTTTVAPEPEPSVEIIDGWVVPRAGAVPEVHPDTPPTASDRGPVEWGVDYFLEDQPRDTPKRRDWIDWCNSVYSGCLDVANRMYQSLDYLGAREDCILGVYTERVHLYLSGTGAYSDAYENHSWHLCATVIDPIVADLPVPLPETDVGFRLSDVPGITLADRCRAVLTDPFPDLVLGVWSPQIRNVVPVGDDCDAWAAGVERSRFMPGQPNCTSSRWLASEWMEHHHGQDELYSFPPC